MKTKVWIVIWGLKDGGAEVLARDYARLVDKQAFDATIVTMYPFENTANFRRAKESGIRIISVFKRRNVVTRTARLLAGRWYVPLRLKAMLKREQPAAIHFNSQMASYFTSIKKYLSRMKLIYTCHNEVSKYFSKEEDMAVRELIRDPGLRLVALHEDMRKGLDQHFSCANTVVIRNGVDLSCFRGSRKDRLQMRQDIGIPQNAFVVGHVGRFAKVKNHAFLLQVFQQIATQRSDAHLLLVGNGELYDEIVQTVDREGLKDRVTILSHRTDIPDLLHAMDVMVFPSFFEGLSVALVEAQASGLRCVISDMINPANHLSEKTVPVSLNESAAVWAEIALNDSLTNAEYGDIEAYDINNEIHRLERLYQGWTDV